MELFHFSEWFPTSKRLLLFVSLRFIYWLYFSCNTTMPNNRVWDFSPTGTGPGQGTFPSWINPAGTIVGLSVDSSGVGHGFPADPVR